MVKDNSSAFVSVPSFAIQSTRKAVRATTLTNKGPQPMLNRVSQAAQLWNSLPEDVKTSAKDSVRNKFTSSRQRASNEGSSSYSLTDAPNPKRISLNTGIKPKTYTSDLLEPVELACSPLHVCFNKFVFPTGASQKLTDYFKKWLAFELQNNVQVNVTFNIDLVSAFSATNILTAMNSLTAALQTYFYYASIISYSSEPSNGNAGMNYLRSQITAQNIEDLKQLARILQNTPVPPNLFEMLRYLSGNFLSGDTPESPLLIMAPVTPSATGFQSTSISVALINLDASTTKEVFKVMRKAIPQWKNKNLYDVEAMAQFDKNFLTLFANMPSTYYKLATLTQFPQAVNSFDVIKYNTYTTELDGAIFALSGAYDVANSVWQPGLIIPMSAAATSTGNSRMSYYTVGGVTQFYPADLDPFLTKSRQHTYSLNEAGTSLITTHLFGTNMCEGVTPNSIRETANDVLDYLMSPDTIKIDVKKFHFGSESSSRKPRSTKSNKRG